MSRESVMSTDPAGRRAERASSVVRGLDEVNRAVKDGCMIRGIKVHATAGDGRSLELEVVTLGLPFVVAIRPGTIEDAADEPDVVPMLSIHDDGCGDEPRSFGPFGSQAVDPTD